MNILSRVASGVARVFARRTVETRDPTESRAPFTRPLSGVRVTPDTAITVAAVWACLRYLSQTVAVLPWRVMLDDEKGPVVQSTHHVDKLLHVAPNPEWTPFQWVETLVHWALRYGNGYAEIARDSIGRPTALWPLHPDRVEAQRDEQGNLVYRVSNGTAPDTILAAADMFHIRGFGDGVVGVNVMEYAAEFDRLGEGRADVRRRLLRQRHERCRGHRERQAGRREGDAARAGRLQEAVRRRAQRRQVADARTRA